MSCCSLFKFFLVISTIYIVSNALTTENIIGGRRTNSEDRQYQAGIVGKTNGSNVRKPIGGGAIIAENYVITSFRNLFNTTCDLKEYTYYAVAGSTNINNPRIMIEVDEIYISLVQTITTLLHDFSIVKLKYSFDFYNMKLTSISIWQHQTSLIGYKGNVSGYGYDSVQMGIDTQNGKPKIISWTSSGWLHSLTVDIVDSSHCKKNNSEKFDDILQICAVTALSLTSDPVGLCKIDGGNPLVINNVLVGIAQYSRQDCNNKIYGGIYTNVSHFSHIINGILYSHRQFVAAAYKNRPHIPPSS